jgi:nitrate reductase NapE component
MADARTVLMDIRRLQSAPIDALLLCGLAGTLYIAMLASTSATGSSSGEAAIGEAIQAMFLTLGLWIVLAILLVVGGVMGEMPRWSAMIAVVLHPLSGVATVIAMDMYSRHIKWAMVFPMLLPLLTALYAMWARIPRLHKSLPAEATSIAAWGLILGLSIAALISAAEF